MPSTSTPALVTTTAFSQVVAGYGHTAALKSDGNLFVWGRNNEGQLGLGDVLSRTEPTIITETGWTAIASSYNHIVAKKTDGTVWSWGANAQGQLGLGDLVTRTAPTKVITDTDWTVIGAGGVHSIGTKCEFIGLGKEW